MAQIKVVSKIDGNILEWDRVVWGDRGQPFCFEVSPYGTVAGAQKITETGDIDADELVALINARVGVVRKNNPNWEDVKTDSDGDGASNEDGTRYGWEGEGQLYTATAV